MSLEHVRSTSGFVTLPGVAVHKLCVALIHKSIHTQHETLLVCKTNLFRSVRSLCLERVCENDECVCLLVAVVTGGTVAAYA